MKTLILAACALVAHYAPATAASNAVQTVATVETRHLIPAGTSQRHFLAVRAGQISQVTVSPARSRDMEIYLFDACSKLLAADLDASDGLSLGVRPGWEGPFTLVVRNISRDPNMYSVQAE